MNEKIKQICQQKADYWMNHYDRKSKSDMSLLYTDIEKFAQLIIEECIEQIKLTMARDGHSTEHYKQSTKHIEKIKEQFGVEE